MNHGQDVYLFGQHAIDDSVRTFYDFSDIREIKFRNRPAGQGELTNLF